MIAAMSFVPPAQRLKRVLGLARFDALSMVLVAAPAALVALGLGDHLGATIGTGITLCGTLEWMGRRQLQQRRLSGIGWLVAGQLLCLSLIILYAIELSHSGRTDQLIALLPNFTREQIAELFPDPESLHELLFLVQRATAAALALSALLYQGGLAFYYLRSAPAARAVFAEPPVLGPPPAVGSV